MLISVLIPAFNEENTIIEILDSVNEQSNEDYELEIIVIDDSSTDSTRQLLEDNKVLYSKLIKLEKNLGKGGAVREGLKSATGSYVLFQDADLEYNPIEY